MNIGVIGYGYWGPNIVRNFNALEDVQVAAVSDLRPERLKLVRTAYPHITQLVTDPRRLLDSSDIEAVAICTPVATHFELAREALQRGKHVLVEKPMTATSEQAAELIEQADRNGCCLMVDHTFVYTGAVRKIKRILESGELGELYYYDGVRVNLGLFQHDVNVVWDLAPHDLSIMDYLLPGPPRSVAATGVAHFNGGQENIAYLTIRYDNNLIAHLHVNWLAPVKVRQTMLSGSKKMIIYDDNEPSEKVKVYDRGVAMQGDEDRLHALMVQYRLGDMYAPRIDQTEALARVTREFCDAVQSGSKPLTDGEAGRRVVRLLEAADESMRNNGMPVGVEGL
ncbi:MAG: gfo/Idh/MocA family oxidoreductase [Candidatus Zixiibacteriota bacterium]|nr:MAG: gfo/Idh/MocA family oxidoreductase [candidate division Zixibacteria bacterium]